MPTSKPLATMAVGHWSNSLREEARSVTMLYSLNRFWTAPGVYPPAIADSNRTFCRTRSVPPNGQCSSGPEAKSRTRFVEKPTWMITTDRSACFASTSRKRPVASRASLPLWSLCG